MKRFAQTVMLKNEPGIIKRYEEHHANIWPEVVEGVLNCGVKRVYIYRYGRLLFMFMETADDFDMERDMPRYMTHPKAKEWDELMRSFQEPVPGAPEDSTWVRMKEIYVLEAENEKTKKR